MLPLTAFTNLAYFGLMLRRLALKVKQAPQEGAETPNTECELCGMG